MHPSSVISKERFSQINESDDDIIIILIGEEPPVLLMGQRTVSFRSSLSDAADLRNSTGLSLEVGRNQQNRHFL